MCNAISKTTISNLLHWFELIRDGFSSDDQGAHLVLMSHNDILSISMSLDDVPMLYLWRWDFQYQGVPPLGLLGLVMGCTYIPAHLKMVDLVDRIMLRQVLITLLT